MSSSQRKPMFLIDFLSGAVAGSVAAVATTPIDVIKTRRQMYVEPSKALTSTGIFFQIIKEEGWSGFSKGWLPRVAKVAPACAIMISSYEFCKRHISKLH